MIYSKRLIKMAEEVWAVTGICGAEMFAIAALAIEYRKVHRGIWKDNT